jgi:hypothetical protein
MEMSLTVLPSRRVEAIRPTGRLHMRDGQAVAFASVRLAVDERVVGMVWNVDYRCDLRVVDPPGCYAILVGLTIRSSPWPVCWARLGKAVNLLHLTISRTRSRRTLRGLAFSDHLDGRAGSVLQLPHPLLVLRHAIPVILESVVAPFAAYYCVLLISGFRGALVSALAWSYFLIGRRLLRHERVSTLLLLGTALLTLRTIVSFITDSAFVYFIQPTMSAFLASFLLVLTGLVGRPFTQRFTHDFCPLTPELLARPSVHRFFIRVSFLWAVTMFLNGAIVLTLLLTASARSFPLERLGATVSVTAAAIFFSINWFARTMRRDGVTVSFVGSQALTRLSHD